MVEPTRGSDRFNLAQTSREKAGRTSRRLTHITAYVAGPADPDDRHHRISGNDGSSDNRSGAKMAQLDGGNRRLVHRRLQRAPKRRCCAVPTRPRGVSERSWPVRGPDGARTAGITRSGLSEQLMVDRHQSGRQQRVPADPREQPRDSRPQRCQLCSHRCFHIGPTPPGDTRRQPRRATGPSTSAATTRAPYSAPTADSKPRSARSRLSFSKPWHSNELLMYLGDVERRSETHAMSALNRSGASEEILRRRAIRRQAPSAHRA